MAWTPAQKVQLVAGGDYLHGNGDATGADFDYTVPLDGRTAPVVAEPTTLDLRVEDLRDFFGAYAWPSGGRTIGCRSIGGIRLNITREERGGGEGESEPAGEEDAAETHVRPSASVGATWTAWQRGADAVRVYTNSRDSSSPRPSTSASVRPRVKARKGCSNPRPRAVSKSGLKTRCSGGRFEADLSVFNMDFENLVVSQAIEEGLPELVNAGSERFKGVELETPGGGSVPTSGCTATYAWHDAKFRDFVQDFDGVPTQLEGNRLEMSARNLASAGLIYAPARGLTGSVVANYVGDRFLNKRNTALAPAYTTWSAGLGYRFENWEIRLDGENLDDTRPAGRRERAGRRPVLQVARASVRSRLPSILRPDVSQDSSPAWRRHMQAQDFSACLEETHVAQGL